MEHLLQVQVVMNRLNENLLINKLDKQKVLLLIKDTKVAIIPEHIILLKNLKKD